MALLAEPTRLPDKDGSNQEEDGWTNHAPGSRQQRCHRLAGIRKSTVGQKRLPDLFPGNGEKERHQHVIDQNVDGKPMPTTFAPRSMSFFRGGGLSRRARRVVLVLGKLLLRLRSIGLVRLGPVGVLFGGRTGGFVSGVFPSFFANQSFQIEVDKVLVAVGAHVGPEQGPDRTCDQEHRILEHESDDRRLLLAVI